MKRKTIPSYSLHGLALIGTSAFIAAILPSKAAASIVNSINNGVLSPFSCGSTGAMLVYSCCEYPQTANCHVTANSGTGVASMLVTEDGHIYETQANTSFSNSLNVVDTTSMLERVQ